MTDPATGLYAEEYFHELLYLERKRTERSKTPFLLVLLNIQKLRVHSDQEEIVQKIGRLLVSSTREIDPKGWYQSDRVVGIIFTEINGIDDPSVRDKILRHLSGVLSPDELGRIGISIHRFPEPDHGKERKERLDLHLYPDIDRKSSSRPFSFLLKRIIDIAGSLAGLILLSPLFLAISILIKITSEGPVLFKQERIGLHGARFTFLKFRSMLTGNDPAIHRDFVKNLIQGQSNPTGTYKITQDPRVTPLGKFLRKSSLDELPQLVNVLKGEMSLVGPRPPIAYELDHYDLWHRGRIMEIKPGITGLWQVKGRSSTTFDEMVRLDLRYAREWSIRMDLLILLSTPWAVIHGKGAY